MSNLRAGWVSKPDADSVTLTFTKSELRLIDLALMTMRVDAGRAVGDAIRYPAGLSPKVKASATRIRERAIALQARIYPLTHDDSEI